MTWWISGGNLKKGRLGCLGEGGLVMGWDWESKAEVLDDEVGCWWAMPSLATFGCMLESFLGDDVMGESFLTR